MVNPPISYRELLDRCLGQPEMVTRVIDRFEAAVRDSLREVAAAADDADIAAIAKLTHDLRATAGQIAAHRLAAACREVEQTASQGEIENTLAQVDALRKAIEECLADVPRILDRARATVDEKPAA